MGDLKWPHLVYKFWKVDDKNEQQQQCSNSTGKICGFFKLTFYEENIESCSGGSFNKEVYFKN